MQHQNSEICCLIRNCKYNFFFQSGNYFQKNVHFFLLKIFLHNGKIPMKIKTGNISFCHFKKEKVFTDQIFFLFNWKLNLLNFFLTNWINRISIFIAIQIRNRISSWNLWYDTYLKIGKQFHYHILTMIHTMFTFGHFGLSSTFTSSHRVTGLLPSTAFRVTVNGLSPTHMKQKWLAKNFPDYVTTHSQHVYSLTKMLS